MTDSFLQDVRRFLSGWKPFAEMRSSLLAGQILSFFEAADEKTRRHHLARASPLFHLHERYRELGLFREGKNERAEQFQRLLELSNEDFAAAIARGEQKEPLALIQYCLEFGRHEGQPRHQVIREFILELFDQPIGGPAMKYSLFTGGVLYSGGGKTHEEMAADFVRLGLGGVPLTGGQMLRRGELEFHYDASSTAYRSGDPGEVRTALLRWIRNTGGQEERVTVKRVERV